MSSILQLLGYAFIPAITMIITGMWAIWRAPSINTRSAIMHFAAGVVFAVLAVEFLPNLVHQKSGLATALGFALGVVAMLIIREWNAVQTAKEAEETNKVSGSLIAAASIDIVVDGLMLGIGFAAGDKQGILLTLALAFELVSFGLAITLELQQGNFSRKRVLWSVVALSILFIVGAVIGNISLSIASGSLVVGMISFGIAALLFLVTEELLDEAHEVPETPVLTSMFFVGFLLIILMEMLG